MPRSAIAAIAAGLTSMPGSDPPDQATAVSPVRDWKKPKGHLRTAGIVGAQEQDHGLAVVVQALDASQRLEPLVGETLGQQRQELGDLGATRELVEGAGEEAFDGPCAVQAGEVVREAYRGLSQGDPLVGMEALPGSFGHGVGCGGHEASPSKLAASRVIRPVMS
jgi:hypothetical protein